MEDVFHWLMASSDPYISSSRKIAPKKSKSLSREAIKLLLSSDGFPCSANDTTSESSDGDCLIYIDNCARFNKRMGRKRRHSPISTSSSSSSSSEEEKENLRRKLRKAKRKLKAAKMAAVQERDRSPAISQGGTSESFRSEGESPHLENVILPNDPLALETVAPLSEELRKVIGTETGITDTIGDEIHDLLARTWDSILKKGIDNESKSELILKYPRPKNCVLMAAPKLNFEVKAAVNQSTLKRDERLGATQTQVGASLAALGKALSVLLNMDEDTNLPLIEAISDAARLLADVHFQESESRRALVSLTLQKDLKDTLINAAYDGWLFGEDLAERVKTAKAIEKSGQELKGKEQTIARAGQSSIPQDNITRTTKDTTGNSLTGLLTTRRRLTNHSTHQRGADDNQHKQILSWVKGYTIPINSPVVQYQAPVEQNWSFCEKRLIMGEIYRLIKLGIISRVVPCQVQYISKVFLISKANGKIRLVLNLKSFNKFVITEHFKLEDWRTASRLISQNVYMASIDLQDAYFAVRINENDTKYLRFHFDNILYQYNFLPFGLSTAPYVFTKMMKPVVSNLRNQGLISSVYLDDFLLLGDSYQTCINNVKVTSNLLCSLGFKINLKKSQLEPSQICNHLGFLFSSIDMIISLPAEKASNVLNLINNFRAKKKCSIRELSKVIGVLVSTCPAFKYGWLYTKKFERAKYLALKGAKGDYNKIINLPQSISSEFDWWAENIHNSGKSIESNNFQLEIFSDSSLSGWGAVCCAERVLGQWSENERSHHINYLELLAAFFALKCFASHKSNLNILLRIDNTTALSYVNRMGGVRFPLLSNLSRDIWQWCEVRNIWIFASYIKSKHNVEADAASRELPAETEYELNQEVFLDIVEKFGSPDIDLFASRLNTKCKTFASWKKDPDAFVVDAFTIDWTPFFFYAFPPFSLILPLLQKVIREGACGIVVTTTSTTPPSFPGGRDCLRQAFEIKGFQNTTIDIMIASITTSTLKQYNHSFKRWWKYCISNNKNMFRSSVPIVLDFLTLIFQEGASFGTLNSTRSALSLLLSPDIGSDYRIKRFMKGVQNSRPPRPRYNFTWNPSIVLDYLKTLYPNNTLSLKDLTLKLVTLMALISAHRVQTLSLILLDNIRESIDGFHILIPNRIKTSNYKRCQPVLNFPKFDKTPQICVANTLKCYLDKTRQLRNDDNKFLIITCKKPYKNANPQTISRWIKLTLGKAGLDTSIFSAHSTRHAATSAAQRKGINLDIIRKTAGWSDSSDTFARFYNRPIVDNNIFSNTILNLANT
ncbi:unnamed protein product [Brassicogethes aeneus]|uniref:Reverse transcriptase domain-containing protein n=1 Tax=Brassicogethes aeneus TaxID=1431903 RepID=A0A9P0AXC3_BRAAE|nr:unnamed protein product [Brassicogethes aeneus]